MALMFTAPLALALMAAPASDPPPAPDTVTAAPTETAPAETTKPDAEATDTDAPDTTPPAETAPAKDCAENPDDDDCPDLIAHPLNVDPFETINRISYAISQPMR